MPAFHVAAIVVNYRTAGLLARNLAGSAADLGSSTFIVDNWSSDAERRRATSLADERGWTVVGLDSNRGFGGGVNEGVRAALAAGHDRFLLVNPDARVGEAALGALLERSAARPRSVVSPLIATTDGAAWFKGAALDLRIGRTIARPPLMDSPQEVPWLSGACQLITAAAWAITGGYDEDYFLYWEDVDFSYRAHRLGIELILCDAATVVHDEGGSQSPQSADDHLSAEYYYYNVRNRAVFARKHLSAQEIATWRRHSVRESSRILLRGGRRKFRHPVSAITPAVLGNWDGWRWRPDDRD